MSTKIVTLACIYLKGQYPKLTLGNGKYLRFRGGRATLRESEFEALKAKMEELGCTNLMGREFAPVGELKNAAQPAKVEVIRAKGLREEVEAQVREEMKARDAQGPALEPESQATGESQMKPDEMERLLAERRETEEALQKTAAEEAKAKREAKAAAKAGKK